MSAREWELPTAREEKIRHSIWSKYLAEFVGTYFLVLTVGCNVLTGSVGAAISIGAMLTVMVYAMGSVSGAHYNPAVTFAILVSGRKFLSPQDAIAYMIAQLLGGFSGALTYMWVCHSAFTLTPVGKFSMVSAASVEVAYSMALCYVVLNVATTRQQEGNNYFGLAIGFTVLAAALAIGGVSGCSLNPAVSFGTMLSGAWQDGMSALRYFPLYFFAPFLGSLLAALAFYVVQRAEEYAKGGEMRF